VNLFVYSNEDSDGKWLRSIHPTQDQAVKEAERETEVLGGWREPVGFAGTLTRLEQDSSYSCIEPVKYINVIGGEL